eukprot:7537052-Lingulodinium_polyedra.AAC.1
MGRDETYLYLGVGGRDEAHLNLGATGHEKAYLNLGVTCHDEAYLSLNARPCLLRTGPNPLPLSRTPYN